MKWCTFNSSSRFVCHVKKQLACVQLRAHVTMNSETEKQNTVVANEKKGRKRKDCDDKKHSQERNCEEKQLKREVADDLQSTQATDSFERPVTKYLCKTATSTLLNNSNDDYSKTIQNSTSLSNCHAFCNDTSMTHSSTNSLFSICPANGQIFVRNSIAYASNMVPSVAALFQTASQHYRAFGVFPQYNPFIVGSAMTSRTTKLLQSTPTCFQRQYRTANPLAASAGNLDDSSAAGAGIIGHPRQWEYTKYGKRHRSKAKQGLEVSVMSYNILSQHLLEDHPYLYENNGDYALSWNYRSKLLLHEIAFHHSEVVCLQEVESKHYNDLINPEFQKLGYEGVYLKRTGSKCDGCAIFFKKDKFSLVKSHEVEFYRGGLLDKDNIAVILELAPKSNLYNGSVKKLCVATTHLLFNPRRGDIKMAQLMVLFAELDKCAKLSDGTYVPIVLCGDFNMEPYSHLYRMICDGHLHYEGLSRTILSGQKEGYYGKDFFLDRAAYSSLNVNDNCQYVVTKDKTSKLKGKFREESSTRKRSPGHKSSHDSPSSTANTPSVSTPSRTKWSPDDGDTMKDLDNCESNKDSRGSGQVRHPLNLVSSYCHHIERLNYKVAEVTTQHKRAACTVDYIFYNVLHKEIGKEYLGRRKLVNVEEGHLRLLARYGLMSRTEIDEIGVMPNPLMPSDHLPLISKFLLKL